MNLTPKQQRVWELKQEGFSEREIAKQIGLSKSAVHNHIVAAKAKAKYADADPGFSTVGRTTLYGPDQEIKLDWVRTTRDKEQEESAFRLLASELSGGIKAVKPIKLLLSSKNSDLIDQYTITDYHIGAYCWAEETGDDWDVDIADQTLLAWFELAIEGCKHLNSENAIFAELGDFIHWDGLDAVTPMSRHSLDADTRIQRVHRIAIRLKRRILALLLKRYKKVYVIQAEGNHDPLTSALYREMYAAFYDHEPRLIFDTSPVPYYAIKHGDIGLFYHHGHLKSLKTVDKTFAAIFREIYGSTKKAYAHIGHLHHAVVIEDSLMILEQHPTLTGRGSYEARAGLISSRRAHAITYHKIDGEVSRATVSIDMVSRLIKEQLM